MIDQPVWQLLLSVASAIISLRQSNNLVSDSWVSSWVNHHQPVDPTFTNNGIQILSLCKQQVNKVINSTYAVCNQTPDTDLFNQDFTIPARRSHYQTCHVHSHKVTLSSGQGPATPCIQCSAHYCSPPTVNMYQSLPSPSSSAITRFLSLSPSMYLLCIYLVVV